MKRIISALLIAVMTLSLVACGGTEETAEETTEVEATEETTGPKYEAETETIRVSYMSNIGEAHHFISQDKGYYDEEGIVVEDVIIDKAVDALTALSAGTTDVLLTYSTMAPLAFVAKGEDWTIFAGNKAEGGTPLFALEETEYTGFESLVGKKIGIFSIGSDTVILKMALKQAGYDVDKDFEFVYITTPMEGIEAVANGTLDFSMCMTGFETVRAQYGMKDVWYPDDDFPMYSCCRVVARTEWLEENPNTAKAFLRAHMKAQTHLEDMDYVNGLLAEKLDQPLEQVEGYMLNPHHITHLDPLKNSIVQSWDWAIEIGMIDNSNNVDVLDHVNTDLYEETLNDLIEEDPDNTCYQDMLSTFEEFNK